MIKYESRNPKPNPTSNRHAKPTHKRHDDTTQYHPKNHHRRKPAGINFYGNAGIASNGSFSTYSSYTSGYLSGSGTRAIYATSGGTITAIASSQRYKTNIETVTDASWIYNLRPVNFDWKDQERAKTDGRQIGLIAEEVAAQYPLLAWNNLEGQIEGVHYEYSKRSNAC